MISGIIFFSYQEKEYKTERKRERGRKTEMAHKSMDS